MDNQLDASAAELFKAATDRDPAERPAYLDGACGIGTPLRARVEKLLRADLAAGEFLDGTTAVSPIVIPAAAAASMIGQRVGRYRIDRLIGSGGMGSVYEATQESPRRTVAIKLMRAGIISQSTLRRFEYESQVLAQLRHPGVVQIFEAGVHDKGADEGGIPYFAMEFIPESRSILEFAGGRNLGVREKLELFSMVCDAVHHGHQKGVIHRDLKPGNILVDPAGQPKVIDFGVARAIGSDLMVTTVHSGIGQIIGTLRYMSPEQCDADPLAIDIRSDVYALGVVLYELLTEKLPYDVSSGPIAHALHVIRDVAPGRLSAIDRALRGDVETIVMKCLAKEPERRYQGVGEVGADIRRYLDRRPIAARPPRLMYQIRTFAKRNKLLVGGTAALLLSLLAGLAGTGWGLVEARKQAHEAQFQAHAARFQAYVANVIGADAALQINDSATARQRLNDAPPEYRNWEWRYLNNHVDASVRSIRLGGSGASIVDQARSIAFSPDGKFLALSGGRILRFSTGETTATLSGPIIAVAWSPNGNRVATADNVDHTASTWDAASGQRLKPFAGHSDDVNAAAFSPDGLRIATGSRDHSVKLWDAQSAALLQSLSGHQGDVRSVVFSPDGGRLISGSYDHTVRIWDISNAKIVHTLIGHTSAVISVDVDKQGDRIASAGDGTVRIWDARSGVESLVLRAPAKYADCAAFSPDGRFVATGWDDGAIRMWSSTTGELISTLRGSSTAIWALAFSPDGRQLVSGAAFDGALRVWDPETVPEPTVLRGHVNEVVSVAFSPDGKSIASAGFDTTVRLWDASTGEEIAVLEGHEGLVRAVAFAPNGSIIASGGADHTIRLWDSTDGRELRLLHVPGDDTWGIPALAFGPDSRFLASVSFGTREIWDLRTDSQAPAWEVHKLGGEAIGFSRDGAYFLDVASDNGIRIWRTQTHELVRVLHGHTAGSHRAAFSPDGRIVASVSSDDRSLRIWETTSGTPLHVIQGFNADPDHLAFYPDGSRLAVSFHNGAIKLWDTRSWQTVATLGCDFPWLNSLMFDAQGRRLVCGTSLGVIYLWDAEPLSTRTAAVALSRTARLEAEPIVARLFAQGERNESIVSKLGADTGLKGSVCEAAIRLARTQAGRPDELFKTAWAVVCDRQSSIGQFHRARAIANSLSRNNPTAQNLTALGAARFRIGDFDDAKAALTRAHGLETLSDPPVHAAKLAFLAMAQFKLGEAPAADTTFAELREFVENPATKADEQVSRLVEEAEALIHTRK